MSAMAPAIKTVGMIGLGKMGRPMARLLAAKGFSVVGFDVSAEAAKAASKHGVAIADTPASLAAKCELVIVVTGFEHQAEDALFGKDGAVESARPGTIIGMASTISPSGMADIAKRLAARSLVPLDIPLCRGEPAAEAGTLLITGGGEKEAFERCRPAFAAFADAIFHLGPVGAVKSARW
jgi:3-hydroxyisobutyrate dehydrogenase